MSEIIINSISKTYNPGLFKKKVKAVQKLSLEVSAGEVYGLIGPNGAGKSTIIRILMGLMRPDSGSAIFRGTLLPNSTFYQEVGYLPENPYLYDYLNLDELLDFCRRVSGVESQKSRDRAEILMTKLGVIDARKRPLKTFSKGMLQRAGICFALLHDPSVIILDEPMSGLDPIGRKMVFDLIMELKGEGKTIFFCSHILSDVERLCDRIGLLNKGKMLKVFSQSEFLSPVGNLVHVLVDAFPDDWREQFGDVLKEVKRLPDGVLLSVIPMNLERLVMKIQGQNVSILGTKNVSNSLLEDLFMQAVTEADQ